MPSPFFANEGAHITTEIVGRGIPDAPVILQCKITLP